MTVWREEDLVAAHAGKRLDRRDLIDGGFWDDTLFAWRCTVKIEAGKYYKRRDGKFGGIAEIEDGSYPVRCGGNYYSEDGHFYDSNNETQEDLIEECNADGSPIVPVEDHLGTASWETTFDKQRRQEIALKVLPSFVRENPRDSSYLDPRKTVGQEAVERAFYIADEFIKVAKQS